MKEIPVLFNGAMVRAILDDRKTQTRRIVKRKHEPSVPVPESVHCLADGGYGFAQPPIKDEALAQRLFKPAGKGYQNPLGKPGDRLWVRETWAWPSEEDVLYFADPWARKLADQWKKHPNYPQVRWKPSIHMPRRFARLFLDVLDVRIERLQDISEEDARAEGFGSRAEFFATWASIYGQESVDANHWVFATTFRKVP